LPIALIATALCAVAPSMASAQTGRSDMPGMSAAGHAAPVSAKARAEVASVAQAARSLNTTSAAAAAGFTPVFGWIPTMGVHWVDQSRMVKAQQTNITAPDNLMFSKIDGRDSLVGAAYAYFAPVSDTTRPLLFDGAPPWHEHTNLAPPGQTLAMLHVWFVPSPDGPFAGTNPNLPFWAEGLAAPDAGRMHDAAFNSCVRRAALALAEVADTTAILPNLEDRPRVRPVLVARRDSVRALVPALLAAQNAHDPARWDSVADRLAAQWDAMDSAYVAAARTADGKRRIEAFISMLMGQHMEGMEHMH
jgi:hypothetical protein